MRWTSSSRGFSLVELLVVVTLIVMLLALLAPAMDKALYRAELAACAGRMHGIGTGTLTYALAHKQRYYHRPGMDGGWDPPIISKNVNDGHDLRPLIRGFVDLGFFNDPLAGKLDFGYTLNDNNTQVSATCNLYGGWQYRTGGERGMFRMGDRFTYLGHNFRVLVSDQDFIAEVDAFGGTDHPDRDGVFWSNTIQNGDNPDYLTPGSGTALGVLNKATVSRWTSAITHQRGLLDRNFLYDDNSVELFTDLPWQDNDANPLIQVPARGDLFFMWYSYLPER